jgi:hypothetical protein
MVLGWHVWVRARTGHLALGAWRTRPLKFVKINLDWLR